MNMKGINELISDFLSERDVTPETKRSYKYVLKSWVLWVVVNPDANIYALARRDVIAWKSFLIKSGKTDLTIEAYMKVLGLFYAWLERSGQYPNIAKGIYKRRRYAGYRRKYLTLDQVKLLLSTMPHDTLTQKRNLAIVTLMVTTGLRCVEVCRLCISDLTRFESYCSIKIQRKGHLSKDQNYCLGLNTLAVIDLYLNERRADDMSEPLFINHGLNSHSLLMRPSVVGFIVTSELNRIGLTGSEYVAHSLRHTFAVLSLLENVSIYDVRMALGHQSVAMTEIYLSSVENEKRKMNSAVLALDKRLV